MGPAHLHACVRQRSRATSAHTGRLATKALLERSRYKSAVASAKRAPLLRSLGGQLSGAGRAKAQGVTTQAAVPLLL